MVRSRGGVFSPETDLRRESTSQQRSSEAHPSPRQASRAWLGLGLRSRRKKQYLHFLTLRQCAPGDCQQLLVSQLIDGNIATINHLCVEISVLVFFALNPETGEFGFRND